MGESSQLPSQPGLHIDDHYDDNHYNMMMTTMIFDDQNDDNNDNIDEYDIDDHEDDDQDDIEDNASYLFLPDALKELQHGEGGVGGAIIRPARELEI